MKTKKMTLAQVIAALEGNPSIDTRMLPALGMSMDQWLSYAQLPTSVAQARVRILLNHLKTNGSAK